MKDNKTADIQSLSEEYQKLLQIKGELYRVAEDLEKLTKNPDEVLKQLGNF